MRDSVRRAAGLRADRHLSPPVAARALACLRRFGERLRGIPAHQVRAVGTNTMRKLAVGNEFVRSEEHTSELQSLMRISYAVFCLKKKNTEQTPHTTSRNRTTSSIQ